MSYYEETGPFCETGMGQIRDMQTRELFCDIPLEDFTYMRDAAERAEFIVAALNAHWLKLEAQKGKGCPDETGGADQRLLAALEALVECCQLGPDADWPEGKDPLSVARAEIAKAKGGAA
jgi:hypothetical protein